MHVLIKRKLEGPSIPELGQPTSATFDSVTVPVARPSTGPAALASYELQRSLDGTTWSTIATGPTIFGNPAAQYVDGGRTALTTYHYRARATDVAGRVSDFCAPVSGETLAGPNSGVVNVSPRITGTNAVTVNVTVNPPAGTTVIAYAVRRSTDGASWSTLSSTPTNWFDDLLAPYPFPTAAATRTVNRNLPATGTNYHSISAAVAAITSGIGEVIAVSSGIYNETVRVAKDNFTIRAADRNNPPIIDGAGLTGHAWDGSTMGIVSMVALQGSDIWWDSIHVRNSPAHLMMIGECRNNGFFTGPLDTRYRNIRILRSEFYDSGGSQGFVAQNVVDAVFAGNKCYRWGASIYSNFSIQYASAVGAAPNWKVGSCWGFKALANEFCQGSAEWITFGLYNDTATNNVVCYDVEFVGNRVWDGFSNLAYLNNIRRGTFDRNLWYKTNDYTFWDERNASGGNPKKGFEIGNEMNNEELLIGPANFGYQPDGISGCRDLVIRNNVFTGCVTPFLGTGYTGNTNERIFIENNTFFSLQTGNAWYGDNEAAALAFRFDTSKRERISDITFRNNLIDVGSALQAVRPWQGVTGSNAFRSNLWSHLPIGEVRGAADIVSAATGLTNRAYIRTVSAPLERPAYDTTAFCITSNSPALNSGEAIAEVTRDFFGQLRPGNSGRLDRGAHSLSKPASATYADTPSTAQPQYYQAVVTFSDGTVAQSSAVRAQ